MQPRTTTTAAAKVLSALCLFAHGAGRLSVADVMRRLGVSSATAYRYLAELEDAGLVSRFANGEYLLGPEVFALDRAAREHDPYVAAAQPVMAALARETGATVILGRPHGGRLVYAHDVPGHLGPPRSTNMRGKSVPLRCAAMPETVLADPSRGDRHDAAAPSSGRSGRRDASRSTSSSVAGTREPRGRVVDCSESEIDPDAILWLVAIHRGKQMVAGLGAVFRRQTPSPEPARMADQMWRAALRIEGRLKAAS